MNRETQQQRTEFIATIISEYQENRIRGNFVPTLPLNTAQVGNVARKLLRYGTTSARIAESICNDCLSDSDSAKRSDADNRNDNRITDTVALLGAGWGVALSGDPRGHTVKIKLPSGRTNDFGQTGFCVPTS